MIVCRAVSVTSIVVSARSNIGRNGIAIRSRTARRLRVRHSRATKAGLSGLSARSATSVPSVSAVSPRVAAPALPTTYRRSSAVP